MDALTKNRMFDEIIRQFNTSEYYTLCIELGAGFQEANTILQTLRNDYRDAMKQMLNRLDAANPITQEKLEEALEKSNHGGLRSIVRAYYRQAAIPTGGGDGTVNQVQGNHQPVAASNYATQRAAVPNKPALPNKPAAATPLDAAGSGDGDAPNRPQPRQPQDLVAAAKVRQRVRQEAGMPVQESGEAVNNVVVADGAEARGAEQKSNIKFERETETKDGDKSKTSFSWDGFTKEHFMVVVFVGAVCFMIYRHHKDVTKN